VDLPALAALAARSLTDPYYTRPLKPPTAEKNGRTSPAGLLPRALSDGCPIHQTFPPTWSLVAQGRYYRGAGGHLREKRAAFHHRQHLQPSLHKPLRPQPYDEPLRIREVKRVAAEKALHRIWTRLAPAASGPSASRWWAAAPPAWRRRSSWPAPGRK
jgi:hypothetical protein